MRKTNRKTGPLQPTRSAVAADYIKQQRDRSKYKPHQGKRECARRVGQMAKKGVA